MKSPNSERDGWKKWALSDWNAALFEHVFSARDGDTTPVTRLVLTDEEFGRVISDPDQPPGEVREAFCTAVLARLLRSGFTLLGDAKQKWYDPDKAVPPFFAHLVVTCIAATWDTDPTRPDGEFRKRLNRFLDRDVTSYWLNELPNLWEELRDWLDAAADAAQPYRRLVLRRQTHLRIIGYSIELAFPALQDTAELVRLFTRAGILPPPSVLPVLLAVQKNLGNFGQRFCLAFEEFDRAVREKDPLRYRCPFWSVVLEAARLAGQTQQPRDQSKPAIELALEYGENGSSRVVPFLDSRPATLPAPPHILIQDHYGSVEGFPFVLETEPPTRPDECSGGLALQRGFLDGR